MAIFLLLGWSLGLGLGAFATALGLLALGFALPAFLTPLAGILTVLLGTLSALMGVLLAFGVLVLCYLLGYAIATWSIAPVLTSMLGLTSPISFPLTSSPTITGPMPLPASGGEFFGRGIMIGITAMTNALLLLVVLPVPAVALSLSSWAFTVISLSIVIFVARNRVFQGFLAWSSWLFPVSYLATAVGLIFWFINLPFALIMFGPTALKFDWTTGVFVQAGGLITIAGIASGFSLGNFVFLDAMPAAGAFTACSTESHETGHTLNTAALGGVVLWINAFDENIVPPRENLAYGELTAEGHAQNFGSGPDFFVTWWT